MGRLQAHPALDKTKAADVDELRAKIEDAIENRRAKAEARKELRERWIHFVQGASAEGRRKRPERLVAEIKRRPT
jgi:hypothetical protein